MDNNTSELKAKGADSLEKFNVSGKKEELDLAIESYVTAVQLDWHNGKLVDFKATTDLADCFRSRFKISGMVGDIDSAIKIYLNLSKMISSDVTLPRSALFSNIGIYLIERYEKVGDKNSLDRAVEALQLALTFASSSDENFSEDFPTINYNLANALHVRFEKSGNPEDINEAIRAHERAIAMTSERHPDVPERLEGHSRSLYTRFQATGTLDDLNNAIFAQRSVVHLTLEDDSSLPTRLTHLGVTLRDRFEVAGKLNDIEEAISFHQKAVLLTCGSRLNPTLPLSDLGLSYQRRYAFTGNLRDIEESILVLRRAVSENPAYADADDISTKKLYLNLSGSLCSRFDRIHDIDDITEAISLQKEAMELIPENNDDYNNLALLYLAQFTYTNREEHLHEAISTQRKSIKYSKPSSFQLALAWGNLGDMLMELAMLNPSNIEVINESISAYQKAVELTRPSHPNLPGWLDGLGNSFHIRFDNFKDIHDMERTILLLHEAIDSAPSNRAERSLQLFNLGFAYKCLSKQGSDSPLTRAKHAESAISTFRSAAMLSTGLIAYRIKAASEWALVCIESDPPQEQCLEAHSMAYELLPMFVWVGFDMQSLQNQLMSLSNLAHGSASAAIYFGKYELALEWMEQAQGVIWNQLKKLRMPLDSLRAKNEILANDIMQVSWQLEQGGGWNSKNEIRTAEERLSAQDQVVRQQELGEKWDSLLTQVHQIPGFEDFLQPMKYGDLSQGIGDSGLVIVINTSNTLHRSDALVLKHGAKSPLHVPLSDMPYKRVQDLSKLLKSDLLSNGIRTRKGRLARTPLNTSLEDILSELWVKIMKPIVDFLKLSPSSDNPTRIWWCPIGPLAFLPLHAAGNYGEKNTGLGSILSDYVISSYIPTVTSMVKKPKNNLQQKFNGILVISQPNAPNVPPIPGAAKECQDLQQLFDSSGHRCHHLNETASNVSAVSEGLDKYSWVHLACHASQVDGNPEKSSFHLQDGYLSLSAIAKKPLPNAEFAFLSACQTSMGEASLADEAVHLAAGMYTAGYRSVIATMWSIRDEYAPKIAKKVYAHMLGGKDSAPDSSRAAEALHRATRELRGELGDDEMSYLVWVPYVHIGV
ncbi:CHAT domain-containing protein [Cyathus striatus]|nr:CHAT domain-containing protein [Cyathus striatus]